jgi:hypothetical protein
VRKISAGKPIISSDLIPPLAPPNGSSERRRSAYASLLIVEVLTNLSNHEDEKNSSEFYDCMLAI